MKYGIIGNGHVAKHIKKYFEMKNIYFNEWNKKDTLPPFEKLKKCNPILILIKDSEIENFINLWPKLKEKKIMKNKIKTVVFIITLPEIQHEIFLEDIHAIEHQSLGRS